MKRPFEATCERSPCLQKPLTRQAPHSTAPIMHAMQTVGTWPDLAFLGKEGDKMRWQA